MQNISFSSVELDDSGIPEISPQEVLQYKDQVRIIDVRRPDEYTGELGHIEGAELITLESKFMEFLPTLDAQVTYIFVCRSGARSGQATMMAREQGIEKCYNMQGGMMAWNASKLPIVR